jgi:hypothetical protein
MLDAVLQTMSADDQARLDAAVRQEVARWQAVTGRRPNAARAVGERPGADACSD